MVTKTKYSNNNSAVFISKYNQLNDPLVHFLCRLLFTWSNMNMHIAWVSLEKLKVEPKALSAAVIPYLFSLFVGVSIASVKDFCPWTSTLDTAFFWSTMQCLYSCRAEDQWPVVSSFSGAPALNNVNAPVALKLWFVFFLWFPLFAHGFKEGSEFLFANGHIIIPQWTCMHRRRKQHLPRGAIVSVQCNVI